MFNKLVLFLFFSCSLFSQNLKSEYLNGLSFYKYELIKKNDTITFLSSENVHESKKSNLIFVQGSNAKPIIFSYQNQQFVNLPFDYKKHKHEFNFIIIARKGIPIMGDYEKLPEATFKNKKGEEPTYYNKFNYLEYRVSQVNEICNLLSRTNKNLIYLVGHSEGYKVVSKVPLINKYVSKIVCLSANPFNRTIEKIYTERLKSFNSKNSITEQKNIDKEYENFKIYSMPEYQNNELVRNFFSYEKGFTVDNIKKIKIPILVAYGSKDEKSTLNDLLPILLKKENLELKVFSDMDHNFFKKEFDENENQLEDSEHWDEVFDYVTNWFKK